MKTMTYILNLTLLVVCTQFAFAAGNADTGGKQMYISFEDAQAALPAKEYAEPQNGDNSGGSRSAPDWQDDPGAYEFTATIAGALVMNDGEQMGDEGDILGAFDEDGNVRGIGLMLFPPFGPYVGTPVFEVQLRSNDAGDILSFKYYDASADAILDITETYTFIINDVIGDVIDPITLNIGSEDLSCPACEDVGLFGGAMACAAAADMCGTIAFGTEDVDALCPVTCGTCPEEDVCGVCEGDGSSCADCAGTPNGDAELDYCGVCEGGNVEDDCHADDDCLTVSMTDAYGDGWNGNVLIIGDESFTIESGASAEGTYCGPSDVVVTCGGGSWMSEVSWSISDGSGELLSGGAPFDGCLGTCDDAPEECVNDDSGADSYGDTCSSWYDANESPGSYGCSGGYDDDDFNAATMCCACQGAESPGDDDVVDSPHAGDKLAEAKLNYIEQQNRLDNPIATPDVSRDDCGGTGPDVGCDGVCFSGLEIDECGDCGGGGLNGDGCCYDLSTDCAGTCGGDSFTDCIGQCASAGYAGWIGDGYCDDGTWGLYFDCDEFNCDAGDCLDDCGDCSGGNAAMDDCGVCDGDNSDCADCAGTPYGDAVDDCSGDGDCFSAAWVGDGYCDGADQAWGADLTCYDCDGGDCIDECGVCDGSGIADGNCDCDGNTDDCCGDCGGDNSGCGGSGDVNGGGIDVTDIVLMVGDILETDALDACEAYEADITGDGNVNVLDVIAAVEIILSGQTGGCTDEAADNYDADADYDDGSCSYAPPTCADQGLWDCGDGQCIPTSYVCDGSSEFCNAGWGPDCANGADEGLEACGYTDDCVAGACDDCEFDFTAYGSECCDTAWGEYGLDCNTLESDYNWDCSGCACPGDTAAVCGDGNCSGDENNENCPEDCEPESACETAGGNDSWLGDGWCDSINNNETCGFDTGDCCPTSCADSAANNCPDNPDGCYSTCADGTCCGDCDTCADPNSSDAADCEAADDGGSDTCADCEYDWSAYGSECCDTAADEFGIDCATLTAAYGWDCSGCNCPLDGGGDDGGSACEGNEAWIADGWCDGSNNNEGCGYDGGDCCPSTCVDAAYSCEQYGGDCADCIDPSAEDSNGGGSCADAPDPTCADTDCGYFMSIGYTCYELLGYGYDCSLCEAEGADCSEPEGCSASQWTCADGSCIPAAYYCDGSAENGNAGWGPDCGDGSDEVLEECCANGSYDDATCGTGGGGNCELTMNDSYGDGWNGNEWCSGGQCAGLAAGSSGTASFDFDLSTENCYTCGGGSWGSEVSWSLSCDGSEVAAGGTGEGCFGGSRSADEVSDSDLKLKMVGTHGIIVPERNISLALIGHVTDLNATKADKVKSTSMVKSIVKHNAKKPVDVIQYEAPLNRKAAPKFESKLQRAESVKLIQTAEGLKYEADGFVGFEITLSHGADFEINVTESAFIADYKTTGNTTKVIVVGPETENLFSSTGDYTVVDVIAGTSGGVALSADIVSIPTVFGLNDAYPNPFNPTTSVVLAMPQDGFVSVKVYNLMGQVIATLHEGNLTANSYSFTWDAADVASGMYFLKAETAGNVDIQKIMLMK